MEDLNTKVQLSKILIVGFLMLVGAFSIARPALAQAQDNCPLPPNTADIPDPSVTVQQVENGSASLADFTRVARDESKKVSLEGSTNRGPVFHLGCLVRQEGGPWRSGSIYTFKLTTAGRVVSHAKEMALSGALMDRGIFGQILLALGVPQTYVDNLGSPDAAIAARAQEAVTNRLRQEPDGAFDAGTPGVSGHAAVYISGFGAPIIMVGGFDMTSAHLASEVLDYGDPAVTAADVVDRETLKAFVTEAGNYWVRLRETSDPEATSKGKIIFRDRNGPWRHGDVYLYVLDTRSNNILIHAAFPDRFEIRPLVATVRDVVTGELILPQVLEAAKSSPEGGFVRYFFDDPTDDTDNADIPKVGYAREFTAHVPRGGTTIPIKYIIGSGFYLSSSNVTAARHNNVLKSVMPQVMRAMTASTVDAVSSRVEQAISDDSPKAKELNFGGASSLSDALLAHGQSLVSGGTFDPGRLLAGSSFTLPLNAAGTGGGLFRNVTIWGSGDYRDFSGGNQRALDYEGDVTSVNFGMDSQVGANMLAGFSVSWARAMVDYVDPETVTGELTNTLTSVNPYVGWQASESMNVWATAGYGWGDVEIAESTGKQESDLTQQMVAAGVSGLLSSSGEVNQGGKTTVRIKAEMAYTWADIDGEGTLEGMTLDANRKRLMLETAHECALDSGGILTSSLEVGVRSDGGDGEDGEGFEAGAGLRFSDPSTGVSFEGRARALLGHDGDYDEWGFSGLVRIDPGADGVGLAVSLQPQWGQASSGVQRMWEADAIGGTLSDNQSPLRMNARIAYGMVALWGGRQGVLTPYTDVSLSGEGSQRLSLGGQFNVGSSMQMSLEILHDQPAYGDSYHGIMLRSNFNW